MGVLEREMKGRRARAGRRREREEREEFAFFFRRFSSSLSFCSLLPPRSIERHRFRRATAFRLLPALRLLISSARSRDNVVKLSDVGREEQGSARDAWQKALPRGKGLYCFGRRRRRRQPLFLFLVFRECARKSRSPSPPRPRSDCFTLSLARQQTLSHYRMPEEKSRWERKQLTSSRESVAKGQGVIIFAPKTKAVTIDCASRHRARQPSRAFQFYSFSRKELARGRDRCVARVCRGAEGEGRGC